jgi:phosphoribosyl-dephospho-CoA transferase
VAVVRSLRRVGDLKHLDAGPVSFTINAPGDAKPSEMRLVVFAQQKGPGAVVGAVSTPVTP